MYYIVRAYEGNSSYDHEFWDLAEAEAYMTDADAFCELYLWSAGREEYMDNNQA